jgi:hypothetical protein
MKIDLQQPPPEVRNLEEAQALINALWLLRALTVQNEAQAELLRRQGEIIEAQARRIDALKEKLRTNSRNSSKPPSSDPHKGKAVKPRAAGTRHAGGQPCHPGCARELLTGEHVTHFHDCRPDFRCGCGG